MAEPLCYEKTLHWTITNYSEWAEKANGKEYSPIFKFGIDSQDEYAFRFDIYPKGRNTDSAGYVSFYLTNMSKKDVTMDYDLFIVKGNNSIHKIISRDNKCFKKSGDHEEGWGLAMFIKVSELTDNEKGYFNGKDLIFGCTIKLPLPTPRNGDLENNLKTRKQFHEKAAIFFKYNSVWKPS